MTCIVGTLPSSGVGERTRNPTVSSAIQFAADTTDGGPDGELCTRAVRLPFDFFNECNGDVTPGLIREGNILKLS